MVEPVGWAKLGIDAICLRRIYALECPVAGGIMSRGEATALIVLVFVRGRYLGMPHVLGLE